MFYWRSTSKLEIDIVLKGPSDNLCLIEIKSKNVITAKDEKALIAVCEDYPKAKKIIICLEGRNQMTSNKTEVISVFDFLKRLWSDELGIE